MGEQILKTISLVVVISLLYQGVVWSVPSHSSALLGTGQPSANFYIPEQYGRIELANWRTGELANGQTVILIKDEHCNYEAQRNIEKILDTLIWDYKVDWAGLFFYLSKNSSELSKKSRWMLNCLRIFRPSNPDASDWGGRSWHTTSIFLNSKQKMILSLGLRLYLDILKCSSVSPWESVFSIFNHQKTFSLGRFSINLISIRTVRQKTPGNRGVGRFVNFIYFNQKPLRMFTESFMDIFDFFSFHFINISNVNITFTLKKVNKKSIEEGKDLLDLPITDF